MYSVQGPWYETTISKLLTISPTGCVQVRLMDVGDRETAVAILGADGSSTGQKNKHDPYQQLYVPSRTNISQALLETASNCHILHLHFTFV